jgi:hypothetical protein
MATLALPKCFPRAEVGKLRGELLRHYGPKSDAGKQLSAAIVAGGTR